MRLSMHGRQNACPQRTMIISLMSLWHALQFSRVCGIVERQIRDDYRSILFFCTLMRAASLSPL